MIRLNRIDAKGGVKMTLEELAALPGNSVSPRIAAQFLGVTQYGLNVAAKAGRLGLPYVFSGRNLKISKAAILDYCGYKGAERGEARVITVEPGGV